MTVMRSVYCISSLLIALGLSACSTAPKPLYSEEHFNDSSTFSKTFLTSGERTCAAMQRTLLGQGYILESNVNPTILNGSKKFQPDNDHHIEITFHIVCTPNHDDTSSTSYVNAVQDTYVLKKTNNNASVGVSVLGSLSMPIGQSDDSLVHVASETIRSKDFYERFFTAVERTMLAHSAPPVPAQATPAPAPAPAPEKATTKSKSKAASHPAKPTPVPAPVPETVPAPEVVTPDIDAGLTPQFTNTPSSSSSSSETTDTDAGLTPQPDNTPATTDTDVPQKSE